MSGPGLPKKCRPDDLVQAPNIMNNTQQSKLITELHEAWAVAHGYRTKVQAPSCKPEKAPSAKQQASSAKLK
jgi:hypothetical protein